LISHIVMIWLRVPEVEADLRTDFVATVSSPYLGRHFLLREAVGVMTRRSTGQGIDAPQSGVERGSGALRRP
jgi:hypothetical protein